MTGLLVCMLAGRGALVWEAQSPSSNLPTRCILGPEKILWLPPWPMQDRHSWAPLLTGASSLAPWHGLYRGSSGRSYPLQSGFKPQ